MSSAPILDLRRVAATNPAVDAQKIEQVQKVQQLLQKAGLAKKADYRLSPALGIGPRQPAPTGTFVVRMNRSA